LKKHTDKLMELTKEKLEISSVLGTEMEQYDPDEGPDPKEWLEMDEASRILLIETYHEEHGLSLGDPGAKERNKMHAVFHAVVETQVALGLECAAGQALSS